LTGNQLWGSSSLEGFIRAKDCACIELDLHDGPDGKAIITHGGTLTSKILARDVIEHAILPYVFKKNDHPIILSLEDHLSFNQRASFGDIHIYPSLEDLRRKIIIKARKAQYGQLANICQAIPFNAASTEPCVSSISDAKFNGILVGKNWFSSSSGLKIGINQTIETFMNTTRNRIVRVYPSWTKMFSGNFNPLPYIHAGCQMLAMNVQTWSRELAIVEALFRANGDAPYVLKPESLINSEAEKVFAKKVTLQILSFHQFPRADKDTYQLIDPFVEVSVEGVEADKKMMKRTNQFIGKGMNPVWDRDEMIFEIRDPELAVILFKVEYS